MKRIGRISGLLALGSVAVMAAPTMATAVLPAPPTELAAQSPTFGTDLPLSWVDGSPSTGPDNETGFEIERCEGIGCASFTPLTIAPRGTQSLIDSTVKGENSVYNYRVRAVNADGMSDWSNVAAARTSWFRALAPSGLTATYTATGTTLNWVDNSTNERGFRVERCEPIICSEMTPVVQVSANRTTTIDTSTRAGTTYRYQVFALGQSFDGQFDSPRSDSVELSTGPGLPPLRDLRASATRSTIRLTWRNPTQAGVEVWRLGPTELGITWALVAQLAPGIRRFTDTVLPAHTRFTYLVRSANETAVSPPASVGARTR